MSNVKNKNYYYFVLLALFLGTMFLWREVLKFSDKNLEVYFFDVGQGDGVYLRTPENEDILIDGGPDATILTKLGKVMPFFDRKIELIILSHPQADHLSGLVDVIERYEVGKIIWSKVTCSTMICRDFKEKIDEKKIPQEKVKANETANFGSLKIEFLHPFFDMESKKLKDLNDSTIVARISYQNNSLLFTGDAGSNIEEKLLNQRFVKKTNVLKVGHHGSKNSSSLDFLKAVDPDYAIISVGAKNSYGHPAAQTLQSLENLKIDIFRTDQDGDIRCEGDGEKVECKKES